MRIIGIVLFFFVVNILSAQEYIHEFGKYSKEEFELKECAFDPSAEAVVIYDIGRSFFLKSNFDIIFQRRFKIKVFNKAGLDQAEISIPVYEGSSGQEKITSIEGNTYNYENGEIRTTQLKSKETYQVKLNDHWYVHKFAMPDVKEGSVIEVSYQISSPYIFNFRNWDFQQSIPVIYSDYTAEIDPHFEYMYFLQGAKKFDEFTTNNINSQTFDLSKTTSSDVAYHFVLKNIPAFIDDQFISSPDDYKIKIIFQLAGYASSMGSVIKVMTTWPLLIKDLINHEDFGKYLKVSENKAKDILSTLELPSDGLEKAKLLRLWVTSNINYNGTNALLSSKSVKELLVQKIGNAAEINLFYLGMLRAAGINAQPVIIGTRDYGKIRTDYPVISAFNYVLVQAAIDGKEYLIDATTSTLGFNEVPPKCLNEKGLLVNDDVVKWVNMGSSVPSELQYKLNLSLQPQTGDIIQNCKIKASGYLAAELRSKYIADYDEFYKSLVTASHPMDDSLKCVSLTTIEEPFELEFNETQFLETAEDKLIINPFCGKAISENPFKLAARSYPIDFNYRQSKSFETTINIPSGYSILSKPDNLEVNNAVVMITYSVEILNPETLKVTAMYDFKKDIYPAEAYSNLKAYYNIIVNKLNEKIVLEAKKI